MLQIFHNMCNDTIIVFLIRNDMKTPVDKPYSSFEGNNVCFHVAACEIQKWIKSSPERE